MLACRVVQCAASLCTHPSSGPRVVVRMCLITIAFTFPSTCTHVMGPTVNGTSYTVTGYSFKFLPIHSNRKQQSLLHFISTFTYIHEPAVEMLSRSCIGRHRCDCAECQLSELCVILLLRGAMSEMQKEGFSKKLVLKSTGQGGATL